ncbi:MAG: hypothetical protein DRO99_03715, partial [Candidatus Aenigmatarchaeota archaeon]
MKALFYSINGIGLGHLSRTSAIAKQMIDDGGADIKFFTKSDFNLFLEDMGVPFVKSPPVGIGDDSEAFIHLVNEYLPKVIIYDNFFPHGGLLYANSRGIRNVLILRNKKKGFIEKELSDYGDVYAKFDLFVVTEDGLKDRLPESVLERSIFTGPIIRESVRDNNVAKRYGIKEDDFVVCFTCGGGSNSKRLPVFNAVKGAWEELKGKIDGLKFIVLRGPFSGDFPESEGIIVKEFEKDMTGLLAHCDIVISHAGYNTVNEIILSKKPSILIPVDSKDDCQLDRAMNVEKTGIGWCLKEPDSKHIASLVKEFHDKPRVREGIRKAFESINVVPGNKEVSDAILRLLKEERDVLKLGKSCNNNCVCCEELGNKIGIEK